MSVRRELALATFTGEGTLTGATDLLFGSTQVNIVGYSTILNTTFDGATIMTSITIPASVTSIGASAFTNTGLTTVYISSQTLSSLGVTTPVGNIIPQVLFFGKNVEIRYSVSTTNLTNIIFNGQGTFSGAAALIAAIPVLKDATEAAIVGYRAIGDNAFNGVSQITSLNILDSVDSIASNAFTNSGITTVNTFVSVLNSLGITQTPGIPQAFFGKTVNIFIFSTSTPTPTPTDTQNPTPVPSNTNNPGCFPGNALVQLQNYKIIKISELKVGDSVLVNKNTYSKIYLFTHRNFYSKNTFITLTTNSGKCVTLTSGHYLYVNKTLIEASSVKIGDCLETIENEDDPVISISCVLDEGLFNPHTLCGDIMVNGIRTSTYTEALDPTVAHILLAPVRACYSLCRLFF